MSNIKVGSICSGIEAASVAWGEMSYQFEWFSEISAFPSRLLNIKYPNIKNLGDMCVIPQSLKDGLVSSPDLICGGTPCQAFSLAGWKKGLEDVRGNLTLKFVDIVSANDNIRSQQNKSRTIVFWENVEGVLRDKTNAFGCLVASLAGYEDEIKLSQKWPKAGLIRGPLRNVAWRVIDAKYFGLPQQRKRLYLIAGGKEFNPEDILFELDEKIPSDELQMVNLQFIKEGNAIEMFRAYTDCLYSAYGTKWNGNAAAYNGSLFVSQNSRLRRLSPLECERLMGFPDNYTKIDGAKVTSRYQAVGNSWAVPVVRWLGARIQEHINGLKLNIFSNIPEYLKIHVSSEIAIWDLGGTPIQVGDKLYLNGSLMPCKQKQGDLESIIDVCAEEKLYITPVGCKGILRRKEERKMSMNRRLEIVLTDISSKWSIDEIEAISRIQPRGQFSKNLADQGQISHTDTTLSLWDS
jgi:DNA (cytosine-5)-methyltransferase 1